MPLLKTHTTHHLKLNQQVLVMIEHFPFPPLRPGGNVLPSGARRGLLFLLTFRVMCYPPGYEAFWFIVLKRVSFWKKSLPGSLEVGVNIANVWSTWVAPTAFLKVFILWCDLFNKILNSVCEIISGLQKKYPVLHRVTKGTEFEGHSRANRYKTWDQGLWATLVDSTPVTPISEEELYRLSGQILGTFIIFGYTTVIKIYISNSFEWKFWMSFIQ